MTDTSTLRRSYTFVLFSLFVVYVEWVKNEINVATLTKNGKISLILRRTSWIRSLSTCFNACLIGWIVYS